MKNIILNKHTTMAYSVAADAVLLFHFSFVIAAVAGGFFIFANEWWVWVHMLIVLWSSFINLASGTCPLTPLEKYLREAAGGVGYQGDFIQHYIGRIVYPMGMPRKLELVAGISVLVWNAIVYAGVWVWLPR